MTEPIPRQKHHIVGGGIAGLAAAVYLIRDAGVRGEDIRIYEQLAQAGGSLDGSGDAETGYLTRGGRMFEPHFACTFDLLDTIPSADDSTMSVKDDIMAFNRMVPGASNCRIVRDGKPAADRFDLTLSASDIVALNRLLLLPERRLHGTRIDEWFEPRFFDSNFWLMWSTMFSFQTWHSLAELQRYLRRFIHLFPGFTRIAGILRTRYNQYDSMIAPIVTWLEDRGVEIATGRQVVDVEIRGAGDDRRATALAMADGTLIPVEDADCVYLTLGSMTDGSVLGSNDRAPDRTDRPGGAWTLWRTLAARYDGFGRPDAFCADTDKTAWHSFTATLPEPDFFEFMEDFTNNRTGTGGLITFAESGWLLSIVLFHQPHFRDQAHGSYVFWGYGLRGDRPGSFVETSMWDATGDQIVTELSGLLGLTDAQKAWFDGAKVRPCRMPFITSQFMPRRPGDRPAVRPHGTRNVAVIGQYCEHPRDCVFTVEYSVRSARAAVASLTGRVSPPPPVARTDHSPRVLIRAAKVLLTGPRTPIQPSAQPTV